MRCSFASFLESMTGLSACAGSRRIAQPNWFESPTKHSDIAGQVEAKLGASEVPICSLAELFLRCPLSVGEVHVDGVANH